jgi:valyl-tRNA synthetase
MDTWATSSETPQINNLWGETGREAERHSPLPMTMRPQAHDIIRTWAFYTIVKAWIHHRDVPWRDAMVSGHVQAPGREKISKSKGNAPKDPRDMVEKHGADATRYWALSATLGNDYVYSEDDLKQGRRVCVKIWNAARLAQRHLAGFDRKAANPTPRLVDRWIRARLAHARALATDHLDDYEFGIAKGDVERFFWNDLCDNYLEMVKNRLHDETPEGSEEREAARAGLYDALYGVIRLFAPFIPHVCEAVYGDLFAAQEGPTSIGAAPWPTETEWQRDGEAEAAGDAAVALLTAVRRWRSEQKLSPGKPLHDVVLEAGSAVAARFDAVKADVEAAGRIHGLTIEAGEGLDADEVRFVRAADPEAPVG